jgi:hypothetical protein
MSQMNLNVVSTFKGDGITQATRQLGAFGRQTSSFGATLGKVGGALAAFGVATKAIQFGRETITQARDLERNLFALDKVFGSLAPGMRDFAKNAEDIGLSQSKAAKASVFIGSVLKQSGFEMSAVATETENLVRLGTDLAALYGYDVQEALLGMTALFRGEYDPIEKFGVAMKQSEINSELAARGQDKLTGAARRNAEQTVRLELLYQRAADAMGSFTGQSGSLYTEQKKLGATFENVQATIGTALIPTVVELNEQLRLMLVESTPALIATFEFLADVLEGVVSVFRDALDPTTYLGNSLAALGIQFESLGKTLFGNNFDIAVIFDIASVALGFFVNIMHDLLNVLENMIITFQVMGEQIGLLFTGQFEKLLNFDGAAEIRKRIDFKDTIKGNQLALIEYQAEWKKTQELKLTQHTSEVEKTADAWERAFRAKFNYSRPSGLSGSPDSMERQLGLPNFVIPPVLPIPGATSTSTSADKGSKTSSSKTQTVQEFLQKEKRLLQREQKLLATGVSQGLADLIVGKTEGSSKSFTAQLNKLLKGGQTAVDRLQADFNKTAAGQQELNAKAAKAESERLERQRENDRIAEELAAAERARIEEQQRVYNSFLDAVKSTFGGIKNAILGAFDLTGLGGSTNSIIRNMEKMLTKLRSFSASVRQLATMGLDPALLQQIISMGPMAGARLAATLVAGGANALSAINAGYGEFGSLASEIARTGTESSFRTEAQQNQFTINVNGGVGSGATIGKAIVDAIADYERTSGAVWQRA